MAAAGGAARAVGAGEYVHHRQGWDDRAVLHEAEPTNALTYVPSSLVKV